MTVQGSMTSTSVKIGSGTGQSTLTSSTDGLATSGSLIVSGDSFKIGGSSAIYLSNSSGTLGIANDTVFDKTVTIDSSVLTSTASGLSIDTPVI
ncbi:hypothetical protein ADUPG1_005625, partial [Aduncisulcus paluster]